MGPKNDRRILVDCIPESCKIRLDYAADCCGIAPATLKSDQIEVERGIKVERKALTFGRLELNTCSFVRLMLCILLGIPIHLTSIRLTSLGINDYVSFQTTILSSSFVHL